MSDSISEVIVQTGDHRQVTDKTGMMSESIAKMILRTRGHYHVTDRVGVFNRH